MADQIGGAGISNLTEQDFSNHSSLINIIKANENNLNNFSFQPLTSNSVCMALEKLNVRKATGYDSISPKSLRLAASGIADSLTNLFNELLGKENGIKHGRRESGTQSIKRMIKWIWRFVDQ